MNRALTIFLFLCLSLIAGAQTTGPEMADNFRAEGKIYVVIAVIAVIFISLVVFLVVIERRLSKIERNMGLQKDKHSNA